jgi:hypothetical protein
MAPDTTAIPAARKKDMSVDHDSEHRFFELP